MKSFGQYNFVDKSNKLRQAADAKQPKYTYSRAQLKKVGLDSHIFEDEDEEKTELRKKEAKIKFHRTRLEHLNEELELRLRQYELLVAKEKQLLGAYNMLLFTPDGVNNFQLFDDYSTPARHLRTLQRQRHQQLQLRRQQQHEHQQQQLQLQQASINSDSQEATADELDRDSCGADTNSQENQSSNCSSSNSSQNSKLTPSASTSSNLNLMQLLHRLAGPRRSSSSLAIMTMNYQ